ncbi:response regulator [Polaribacter ponticola]|uniref:Response regulator n=1 Tax=Polaribacter ponticola TaxID=2978475 RepID=A0ABT5S762_9FLAO|nr:response regulator [Polaribacter sp. MSW5]MDD7913908.1 response regulator [Polaribacter sp. MSW5]
MQTNFKILIVEDNVIIADDLEQIIESFGYNVIGNVISYERAVSFLEKNRVDLVLIDIDLATEKTGLDLANYINQYIQVPFIYVTSNLDDQTINIAAKTKPSAYLVKPFDNNTIYASIEVAITNYIEEKVDHNQNKKDHLFLKKNNLYHKVKTDHISYVKSDNIYLEIYTIENDKFLIRNTLKSFLTELPSNFYKCNKSHIININNVKTFNLNYVFINDKQITVSKEFKPYLKSLIN